jgi:hypothetical protein
MQTVKARTLRPWTLLVVLLLTAASSSTFAVFHSTRPGADLTPVGDAAGIVQILQGSQNVLWTSLLGPISTVEITGWPVSGDGTDLGGAVVIENVDGAVSGVVDFGEKPKTLVFSP